MEDIENRNSSGNVRFHLKRIGPLPTKPDVAIIMEFHNMVYTIGRSPLQCDYVIDSDVYIQSASISRCHARVVRQHENQHRLYDDSLNGIFVNSIKINGSCILEEGDRVTFGHPVGNKLQPGTWHRQPDSEHQFVFEKCTCYQKESIPKRTDHSHTSTEQNGKTLMRAHSNTIQESCKKERSFDDKAECILKDLSEIKKILSFATKSPVHSNNILKKDVSGKSVSSSTAQASSPHIHSQVVDSKTFTDTSLHKQTIETVPTNAYSDGTVLYYVDNATMTDLPSVSPFKDASIEAIQGERELILSSASIAVQTDNVTMAVDSKELFKEMGFTEVKKTDSVTDTEFPERKEVVLAIDVNLDTEKCPSTEQETEKSSVANNRCEDHRSSVVSDMAKDKYESAIDVIMSVGNIYSVVEDNHTEEIAVTEDNNLKAENKAALAEYTPYKVENSSMNTEDNLMIAGEKSPITDNNQATGEVKSMTVKDNSLAANRNNTSTRNHVIQAESSPVTDEYECTSTKETTKIVEENYTLTENFHAIADANPEICDDEPIITGKKRAMFENSHITAGDSLTIIDKCYLAENSPVTSENNQAGEVNSTKAEGTCMVPSDVCTINENNYSVARDNSARTNPALFKEIATIAKDSPVITEDIPVIADVNLLMVLENPTMVKDISVITEDNSLIAGDTPTKSEINGESKKDNTFQTTPTTKVHDSATSTELFSATVDHNSIEAEGNPAKAYDNHTMAENDNAFTAGNSLPIETISTIVELETNPEIAKGSAAISVINSGSTEDNNVQDDVELAIAQNNSVFTENENTPAKYSIGKRNDSAIDSSSATEKTHSPDLCSIDEAEDRSHDKIKDCHQSFPEQTVIQSEPLLEHVDHIETTLKYESILGKQSIKTYEEEELNRGLIQDVNLELKRSDSVEFDFEETDHQEEGNSFESECFNDSINLKNLEGYHDNILEHDISRKDENLNAAETDSKAKNLELTSENSTSDDECQNKAEALFNTVKLCEPVISVISSGGDTMQSSLGKTDSHENSYDAFEGGDHEMTVRCKRKLSATSFSDESIEISKICVRDCFERDNGILNSDMQDLQKECLSKSENLNLHNSSMDMDDKLIQTENPNLSKETTSKSKSLIENFRNTLSKFFKTSYKKKMSYKLGSKSRHNTVCLEDKEGNYRKFVLTVPDSVIEKVPCDKNTTVLYDRKAQLEARQKVLDNIEFPKENKTIENINCSLTSVEPNKVTETKSSEKPQNQNFGIFADSNTKSTNIMFENAAQTCKKNDICKDDKPEDFVSVKTPKSSDYTDKHLMDQDQKKEEHSEKMSMFKAGKHETAMKTSSEMRDHINQTNRCSTVDISGPYMETKLQDQSINNLNTDRILYTENKSATNATIEHDGNGRAIEPNFESGCNDSTSVSLYEDTSVNVDQLKLSDFCDKKMVDAEHMNASSSMDFETNQNTETFKGTEVDQMALSDRLSNTNIDTENIEEMATLSFKGTEGTEGFEYSKMNTTELTGGIVHSDTTDVVSNNNFGDLKFERTLNKEEKQIEFSELVSIPTTNDDNITENTILHLGERNQSPEVLNQIADHNDVEGKAQSVKHVENGNLTVEDYESETKKNDDDIVNNTLQFINCFSKNKAIRDNLETTDDDKSRLVERRNEEIMQNEVVNGNGEIIPASASTSDIDDDALTDEEKIDACGLIDGKDKQAVENRKSFPALNYNSDDETRSPVIFYPENVDVSVTNEVVRKLEDDQLSCNFSDDNDRDFPELNMSILNSESESNDDILCGQATVSADDDHQRNCCREYADSGTMDDGVQKHIRNASIEVDLDDYDILPFTFSDDETNDLEAYIEQSEDAKKLYQNELDIHKDDTGIDHGTKRKCDANADDRFKRRKITPEESEMDTDGGNNDHSAIFKSPTLARKSSCKAVFSPTKPFGDHISSTQLISNPETPDLDVFTTSQANTIVEQLEMKITQHPLKAENHQRAKDLLAKLKARKVVKKEVNVKLEIEEERSEHGGEPIEHFGRLPNNIIPDRTPLQNVDTHIDRCKGVISQMKTLLETHPTLPRVQTWRKEIASLEEKLKFPPIVIAVVGKTGDGKSSLLNALMDQKSVLPTSCIEACTAVVVEIVQNTDSSLYKADIEFLDRKEWFDEVKVLLKDLTGLDGKLRKSQPDPSSETFASYCKIKAVYGKIDKYENLTRHSAVTRWLGKTKVVASPQPEEFRKMVQKYIENQDSGSGDQFWPIVKLVRLHIPNCDVCSSGVALVDLPGVRDSNAARDKIAKEYMKNCTAIWVVSSIHRAIDDKTAKDLLGENFRRQLLMDGQYSSVTFICTKTDIIVPHEVISRLKLENEVDAHLKAVRDMEEEKHVLEFQVDNITQTIDDLHLELEKMKRDEKELRDSLEEIQSLLSTEDLENEDSEAFADLRECEADLHEKGEELKETRDKLNDLKQEQQDSTRKGLELDQKIAYHQKKVSVICANARNDFSKNRIKSDFKAGLKEMKRQAGLINDDDMEDLSDDDDDDDDDDSTAITTENLKVFCCSSTEYQKMMNLLDGVPQVFGSLEDTQIPALRQYVHQITGIRRKQALEKLIRSVGRFVFNLKGYVTEFHQEDSRNWTEARSLVEEEIDQLDSLLEPLVEELSSNLDSVLDDKVGPRMNEGVLSATQEANVISTNWASKKKQDLSVRKTSNRIPYPTYRAVVDRDGAYSSKTFGNIDFNEELSEPMYRSLTKVWDRIFNGGMLWKIFQEAQQKLHNKLKQFVEKLGKILYKNGMDKERLQRVGAQFLGSAENKLEEMVGQLKELVTTRQREISRILTPSIRESLDRSYSRAASEHGSGAFMRMKAQMCQGIDSGRVTMFNWAAEKLMDELKKLQNQVIRYTKAVCKSLIQDLQFALEPLWNSTVTSSSIYETISPVLLSSCFEMREIYASAGLTNTEEYSTSTTSTDDSPGCSTSQKDAKLSIGNETELVHSKSHTVDAFHFPRDLPSLQNFSQSDRRCSNVSQHPSANQTDSGHSSACQALVQDSSAIKKRKTSGQTNGECCAVKLEQGQGENKIRDAGSTLNMSMKITVTPLSRSGRMRECSQPFTQTNMTRVSRTSTQTANQIKQEPCDVENPPVRRNTGKNLGFIDLTLDDD